MEYEAIDALREKHAAWRLLRAGNASLILSFLGHFFVEGNRGACAASELAAALDDHLYSLNAAIHTDSGEPRYPKPPKTYLEDWAAPDAGYLRRFYPAGDDEVHYEITPAFEKAYAWIESLKTRPFVATESRLHTAVELLRQIVHGTDNDPQRRLTELRRRRDELDAEIAAVESGELPLLAPASVRDRFQQFTTTARELLSDFREVEENFRRLDRAARERIATWDGAKGELLNELVGSRSEITNSDQGHSFQAFHDFLLSASRQQELTDLLDRVTGLDAVDADRRVKGVHHEWSEAAERAQRTVRQISEQLRRFLDDQVWLENRRVLDLVRDVESAALSVRDNPPAHGLTVDEPGIAIALPFERPLYTPPAAAEVESLIPPTDAEVDSDVLFAQTFIDQTRLLDNIRAVLPAHSTALLSDIVAMYPVEHGAAEIVSYLALADDEVDIEMDDSDVTILDYPNPEDPRESQPRTTAEGHGEATMSDERAVASAIIRLMQGVIYREADEDTWRTLERAGASVRDHFATIGVDVVIDEDEGYAYLRTKPDEEGEDDPLPRLVRRRSLTYPVSLLLVLLRKRLVEFETAGGEGRLVLTTEQITEMLRLFQAESTNEARIVDNVESTIKKAAELGFLRLLRGHSDHWEVRRILKAYVDAQTLADFASKLREYAGTVASDG